MRRISTSFVSSIHPSPVFPCLCKWFILAPLCKGSSSRRAAIVWVFAIYHGYIGMRTSWNHMVHESFMSSLFLHFATRMWSAWLRFLSCSHTYERKQDFICSNGTEHSEALTQKDTIDVDLPTRFALYSVNGIEIFVAFESMVWTARTSHPIDPLRTQSPFAILQLVPFGAIEKQGSASRNAYRVLWMKTLTDRRLEPSQKNS